jgi:hypothetical protein
LPASHATHAATEDAPVAALYVPAPHGVGCELFCGQKKPAGHVAHVDTSDALDTAEYLPASHAVGSHAAAPQ